MNVNNIGTRRVSVGAGLLVMMVLFLLAPAISAAEGLSISIPALGVNSPLTEFKLNGVSWNINPWEGNIGHLEGTAWFGTPGNIALGGHSWLPNNTPGIFVNLHTLQSGQEVIINNGGQELHYTVTGVTSVSMYDLSVLYPTSNEQITLITCDAASFDPNSSLYQRRVIVTAVRSS